MYRPIDGCINARTQSQTHGIQSGVHVTSYNAVEIVLVEIVLFIIKKASNGNGDLTRLLC